MQTKGRRSTLFGSLAMIPFALALVLHPPLCALPSDTGDIIKSMFLPCALRTVQKLQCSHSQGSNPITATLLNTSFSTNRRPSGKSTDHLPSGNKAPAS
jgi:hypothetical protein